MTYFLVTFYEVSISPGENLRKHTVISSSYLVYLAPTSHPQNLVKEYLGHTCLSQQVQAFCISRARIEKARWLAIMEKDLNLLIQAGFTWKDIFEWVIPFYASLAHLKINWVLYNISSKYFLLSTCIIHVQTSLATSAKLSKLRCHRTIAYASFQMHSYTKYLGIRNTCSPCPSLWIDLLGSRTNCHSNTRC